jgi:hypothetical protein
MKMKISLWRNAGHSSSAEIARGNAGYKGAMLIA